MSNIQEYFPDVPALQAQAFAEKCRCFADGDQLVIHTAKIRVQPADIQYLVRCLSSTASLVLVRLELFKCQIPIDTVRELQGLLALSSLQRLNLDHGNLDRPSLRLIMASLPPSLERLSLSGNRIGSAKHNDGGDNDGPPPPPPAKIIHVRRNMLRAPTLDAQGRPMISTTVFMTADLPDADPLAYWVLPRSLNHLSLQGAFLCDADMPAIAKSLPAGLRFLCLQDNKVGKEGYEALAPALPPSLMVLDLCNTGLDDDGAVALAKHLPASLKDLDLGRGTLGDVGVSAVAAVLPQGLLRLNVGTNRIGATGATALAAKLPSSLQVLFIDQNRFGDDGLRAFARALPSGLQLVHAYSVGASESAIAEFRGAAGMAEEIKV